MKNRNIWVFGLGYAAEVASCMVKKRFGDGSFGGFCIDDDYFKHSEHLGHVVKKYSEILSDAASITMFVAVGYNNLNSVRETLLERVKDDGFLLTSLVPDFDPNEKIKWGINNLILHESSLQPFVCLGDNVFVWSGATVCHHCTVGNNVWITAGATIAGNSRIGDNVFIGANATIVSGVTVSNNCFIGAGVFVDRSLSENTVVIRKGDQSLKIDARSFVKFLDLNKIY